MAKTYRTVQGDTWDIISFKVYDSEKYVDILIQQNWQERNRVIFPAGIVIAVPELATETTNSRNLPPWRRNR